MKNIKYIVNSEGERVSVVLDNNSYDRLQKFLSYQLILSVLNLSLEYLKIPNEKPDATLFLKSLLSFADYRKNFGNGNRKYEITVLDEDIAKIQNCSEKTISNQRDQLFDYMKKKEKAIIDFYRHPENKEDGSLYKLNIVESIDSSVSKFFEEINNAGEVIEIINFAKTVKLSDMERTNTIFKNLIEIIKKDLDNISNKVIIIESPAIEGTRKNLEKRHTKGK